MSATLVLIGGETPDAPMIWARVVRGSGAIAAWGEVAPGARAPDSASADTVLVLPGSEAQVKSLDLPATSDVQARAAAAYLFEGALAVNDEQGFYAIADEGKTTGRRLVAAMDRGRLRQWIARCAGAGANPSRIVLDFTIWPTTPGHVQIVEAGGRTIVGGGEIGGFAIESALAPKLIPAWLTQVQKSVKAVHIAGAGARDLATQLGSAAPAIDIAETRDPIEVLVRAAADPPAYAPNLRQGDIETARRSQTPLRAWSLTAGLAAIAVLLQVGILVADGWRDRQSAQTILARSEAEFRQVRPDVKKIVNLRAQVTAALNAGQPPAANPVITASQPVTSMLTAHPDVRLEEMRTEGPGRVVMMRFSGPAPGALEGAVADLRKTDAALKVGQMETSEGRVNLAVSMEAP